MRTTVIQILSVSVLGVAGVWFLILPGPEPVVTALAGLIGLLSARRDHGPDTARPGALAIPQVVRSVAVLPFDNLSADPSASYFAQGVSEDITIQLAKVRDLRVISRNSAIRVAARTDDVREVARELSVSHVLEGSVRQDDDRVRVAVQLTNAESRQQVWAERYDRDLLDVFAIQAEVADRVASALDAELAPSQLTGTKSLRVPDPEAYRLQLLGRFHANKWSQDGWRAAVSHLTEAIRIDPSYSAPHATLAYAFGIRGYLNVLPPIAAFERAEQEARLALALDEDETDAHMALGIVHYWLHWQWEEAARALARAVEISPGNSPAQSLLGSVLDTLGRHEEAMGRGMAGYELDPLDPTSTFNLGYRYMIARRFREAISQFNEALALDPRNAPATYGLGMAQVDGGDPEAGCSTFARGLDEVDDGSTMLGLLGWAHGVAGHTDEAEEVLRRLLVEDTTGVISAYHAALVYLGLGRHDEFFAWLERAYAERSAWMVWFHVTPNLDPVRDDPRFSDLASRMGLPLGTDA